MTETFLVALAAALLSSLFTLSIVILVIQKRFRKRYEKGLQDAIDKFKAEAGPEIEARVKQGVVDGFKSLPSREMLRDTTRSIAKTGLDIMGDSLKLATRPSRTRQTPRKPGPTPLDDE